MKKLDRAFQHYISNVLPALDEYYAAEHDLSVAEEAGANTAAFIAAQSTVIRKASEVAVALDGLVDRTKNGLGGSRKDTLELVAPLCAPGGQIRERVLNRVEAVANAYKHDGELDKRHPIGSMDDILAVGSGYGVDGFGVGKMGGSEVLIDQRDGQKWKFLGDAYAAKLGWRQFFVDHGYQAPP